jgi:hypothetical protein
MTYRGTHAGSLDPFGGAQHIGAPPRQGPGFLHAQGRPTGEAKTLSTLSIVFAFVFAPVGAVLGHLALSQIKWGIQRGRDRALFGLTLSYVFILFAVVGLVLWAFAASDRPSSTVAGFPTAAPTVITPASPVRTTVNVENLRMRDCIEIQQTQPYPYNADLQMIKIFPVTCDVRDGVFLVDLISSSNNPCTDVFLVNVQNTVFACISKFKGDT